MMDGFIAENLLERPINHIQAASEFKVPMDLTKELGPVLWSEH